MSTNHNPSREPAGRPTGGQFSATSRPGAGLSLATGGSGEHERLTWEAMASGWPVVAEQVGFLMDQGTVSPEQASRLDRDHCAVLGEDVAGPTLDQLEDAVWQMGASPQNDSGLGGKPVLLDENGLRRRCAHAGLSPDVAGFVRALDDRDVVNSSWLSNLDEDDLCQLERDVLAPARTEVASQVIDPDSATLTEIKSWR